MNTRAKGFLLALYLGASGLLPGVAWGQSGAASPPAAGFDANPIGKVLNATGSVTIEHTSGILVQANLPAGGNGQAKVGDAVYRGDLIQTHYPTMEEGLAVLVARPASEPKWDGPYLTKDVPLDPWGNPYVFKIPGDHGEYDLLSYGKDGQPGGTGEAADVTNW